MCLARPSPWLMRRSETAWAWRPKVVKNVTMLEEQEAVEMIVTNAENQNDVVRDDCDVRGEPAGGPEEVHSGEEGEGG